MAQVNENWETDVIDPNTGKPVVMDGLFRYCGTVPDDDWVKRVERLNAIIDAQTCREKELEGSERAMTEYIQGAIESEFPGVKCRAVVNYTENVIEVTYSGPNRDPGLSRPGPGFHQDVSKSVSDAISVALDVRVLWKEVL